MLGKSATQVESGGSLANQAGQAFEHVFARVGEIARLIEGIAMGAREQAAGLGEINAGVTDLDQVTQQNAAMVEEATAASSTLQSDAEGLARKVARFQIRRAPGTPLAARRAQSQARAGPSEPVVAEPALAETLAERSRDLKAAGAGWQDF